MHQIHKRLATEHKCAQRRGKYQPMTLAVFPKYLHPYLPPVSYDIPLPRHQLLVNRTFWAAYTNVLYGVSGYIAFIYSIMN